MLVLDKCCMVGWYGIIEASLISPTDIRCRCIMYHKQQSTRVKNIKRLLYEVYDT